MPNLVVISMLTENKGHLLKDDVFWVELFRNQNIYKKLILHTSPESISNLNKNISDFFNLSFVPLKSNSLFNKYLYRINLLYKVFSLPKYRETTIIFQAFDELTLSIFLAIDFFNKNSYILVATNNISKERFSRSKILLKIFLRILLRRSKYIFLHSEFEKDYLENKLNSKLYSSKIKIFKYHAFSKKFIRKKKNLQKKIITIFGPFSNSKSLSPLFNLINKDINSKYYYQFVNFDYINDDLYNCNIINRSNIKIINNYLSDKEYLYLIDNSTFVFLPHNSLFEGKISGIFSDSISLFTPVISDKISPVTDFFNYYGPLGYIYDFTNQKWSNEFLEQNIDDYYEILIDNIELCVNNHSLTTISRDFISIINENNNI